MNIVVHEASTLINLLKSGLLTIAAEALELRILTTDLVAAEIIDPRTAFDLAVRNRYIELRDISKEALLALIEEQQEAKGLSIQDVSVISLARAEGCPLFSSDGRVRTYARQCAIIVYGELWILDQLIFRGAFTPRKAATKLREMLLHNARLPQREVDARMTRWSRALRKEGKTA